LQRDRADDPRDAEPDAGGERGAQQSIDLAQTGQTQRCASVQAEALEAARQHAAGEQGSDEPEQRGVLGV
jgi:hypothetical protein